MAEFALVIGGQFREFRELPSRPPDISHKAVQWFPVVRSFGDEFEGVEGDEYLVVVPEPVPPDPGMTPPRLTAATFNLTIENGDITSIGAAFNLIGALYLGVGQYELFFLQPQPDLEFYCEVSGAAHFRTAAKGLDYVDIEARESPAGQLIDPECFTVQVFRI